MNKYVLVTKGITKIYGNQKVLENVSMSIRKGDIYGFVGKNGAGKTTMMRVLAGLVIESSGEFSFFGCSRNDINKERQRISTLIESPNFYTKMTAEENLELIRIQRGIPGRDCIEKVIKLVNLKDIKGKKVKDFSLGMKQRLAIASTLLNDPEF